MDCGFYGFKIHKIHNPWILRWIWNGLSNSKIHKKWDLVSNPSEPTDYGGVRHGEPIRRLFEVLIFVALLDAI